MQKENSPDMMAQALEVMGFPIRVIQFLDWAAGSGYFCIHSMVMLEVCAGQHL